MKFRPEEKKPGWCKLWNSTALAIGVFAGTALDAGASVIPLEGEPIVGPVTAIADGSVRVEGVSAPISIIDILRVENAKSEGGGSVSPSASLFLVGGGRVPVSKIGFDPEAETFEVEVDGAGSQKLAVDVVGAVLFNPKADLTRFNEVRAEPTTEFDRVLIDVGAEIQIIRGLLDGFGDEMVSLDVDGETREFPREKVMGIVLASLPPEVVEQWVEVVATNGSVFTGESVSLTEPGMLAVHLGAGNPLQIPWSGVARVEFFSPRIAFLSDLRPKSSATAPIVALPRETQMGSNVLGGVITMGGRSFRRGIGMPGGAEVMFKTEGFERFKATVGIDDASGGRGDCQVVVIASGGQELFRQRIKGGEPPKEFSVDLSGVDSITLSVEPGEDLDLADYANWGDAVLIRKEK